MIAFKNLKATDIETAVAMMRQFYAIDGYPIDVNLAKELFSQFIADENLGRAWLIYSDDEPVGYIIVTFIFSFEYKGRVAFLDELFISGKARGKGIGKHAVDFVLKNVESLSLKLIYLEVEKHNKAAEALYLSKGFIMHNRNIMRYPVPENQD